MDQFYDFLIGIQALVSKYPLLVIATGGMVPALWSVLSDTVTYWAARRGGRPSVERVSRWLRLDLRHIDRAERLFARWGIALVLFGRILPGVRTLVSVPAGMTRMNFGLFVLMSFGGAFTWNALLATVSYLMSARWLLWS